MVDNKKKVASSPVQQNERVSLTGVFVALLCICTGLLIYHAVTLRRELREDAALQASLVAQNLAASVAYKEHRNLSQVLSWLDNVPYIESLCVYTNDGQRFARYAKPNLSREELEEGTLANVGQRHPLSLSDVFVEAPVVYEGTQVGYVVLVATPGRVADHLRSYAGFLLSVALCAIWLARFVMSRMNARVSRAEDSLLYLATTDPLTNLANRRTFCDELGQRAQAARESGQRLTLFLIDLDDFKRVNDSFGHAVGDAHLRKVATMLRAVVQPSDLVGRFGGDEFAVLVSEPVPPNTWSTTRIGRAVSRAIHLEEHHAVVSLSVGFSRFPDDADNVANLINHAELALHAAKRCAEPGPMAFKPEMTVESRRRTHIEKSLRCALEHDELTLVYQPQFDAKTAELIGAEALLRWTNATLGQVSPAEFIPVAEDSDLIVELGQWVLRRACRDAAAWNRIGAKPIRVSVNVSPRQLSHDRFPEDIRRSLRESNLPSHLLEIELTETQMMGDFTRGVAVMQNLAESGLRLALDDFGTGYSSLSYLQSLPVTNLKIDRKFITPLPDNGHPIVTAIIAMAHSFGIHVVAEGVEHPAQLAWLCEADCDIVQGFLTGRPMGHGELVGLIEKEQFNAGVTPFCASSGRASAATFH